MCYSPNYLNHLEEQTAGPVKPWLNLPTSKRSLAKRKTQHNKTKTPNKSEEPWTQPGSYPSEDWRHVALSQASPSYQGLGRGWLCLYHQPREEEAEAAEFIGLLYIKVYYICKIYCTEPIGLSSVLPKAKDSHSLGNISDSSLGAGPQELKVNFVLDGGASASHTQDVSCQLPGERVTRDGTKGGRILGALATPPPKFYSLLPSTPRP